MTEQRSRTYMLTTSGSDSKVRTAIRKAEFLGARADYVAPTHPDDDARAAVQCDLAVAWKLVRHGWEAHEQLPYDYAFQAFVERIEKRQGRARAKRPKKHRVDMRKGRLTNPPQARDWDEIERRRLERVLAHGAPRGGRPLPPDPGIHLQSRRPRRVKGAKCCYCGRTYEFAWRFAKSSVGPVVLCSICRVPIEIASFGKVGGDAMHKVPERKRSRG